MACAQPCYTSVQATRVQDHIGFGTHWYNGARRNWWLKDHALHPTGEAENRGSALPSYWGSRRLFPMRLCECTAISSAGEVVRSPGLVRVRPHIKMALGTSKGRHKLVCCPAICRSSVHLRNVADIACQDRTLSPMRTLFVLHSVITQCRQCTAIFSAEEQV